MTGEKSPWNGLMTVYFTNSLITDILWFMGIFYANYNQIIICKALVSCIFSYGTGANNKKQDPDPAVCFHEAESSEGYLHAQKGILRIS
jgi:hypothetical protein